MMAFVKYRGEVFPARLSHARFRNGEIYLTAKLDTLKYKTEKEIHFSSIVQFNWTQTAKSAA